MVGEGRGGGGIAWDGEELIGNRGIDHEAYEDGHAHKRTRAGRLQKHFNQMYPAVEL